MKVISTPGMIGVRKWTDAFGQVSYDTWEQTHLCVDDMKFYVSVWKLDNEQSKRYGLSSNECARVLGND